MGVLKLIEYYTSETKDDLMLTVALVAVIFGVVILFASDAVLTFFRVILGVWIIVTGVMDLQTILIWKQVRSPYWTVALLLAIFMILSGIIILVNQGIVLTVLGGLIIAYGILDIIDRLIFMKKINDYMKD